MTALAGETTDRNQFAPLDWTLFTAVGTIWGASFLLIALGLRSFHPGLITWARVGLGAVALFCFPSARRPIEAGDRARLVALSILWVGIPFTLFPLAEQHINSAVTGLLNGATPIFSGIIGGLFFNRVPRGPQRMGIAVGFAGITLVSLGSSRQGSTAVWGVVMVLAATLCYGVATNLAASIQQRYGSIPVMAKMLGLATLWTTPFGVYGLFHSHWSGASGAATAVLGVVGTGIAFGLMAELVGRVGGPRASIITYLIPVVSLTLGVLFLGDRITPLALIGVFLVLGGAVFISRRER
jgi:drug/metabolite transporter (DMT)-like permease